MYYSLLSLLPILGLLFVSILSGVRNGVYSALIISVVLYFIWDSQFIAFLASIVAAFMDTLTILMIVFGALLLHQNMEQSGFIDQIKSSLKSAHHSKGFQFYFLAFFLTGFFEGVAGFGTPGAIVPLLLISLGFSPILSIVVVLLIDGLFAMTGAIGTPVIAGFHIPLSLASAQLQTIYVLSAFLMLCSGIVVVFFIRKFVREEYPNKENYSWKIFMSMSLAFLVFSFFLQELSGIFAALFTAIYAYFFFFTNRKLDLRPWIPYGFLIFLLLLPKLIPPLDTIIQYDLSLHNIFNTSIDATFQPIKSPLVPFFLASLAAFIMGKSKSADIKPVFKKILAVFAILFPSIIITKLMLSSGTDMPSMIESISELFIKSGKAYPLLSPMIGVMGTFVTGSTTVSNIIFGPVQLDTAQNLQLPVDLILALQLNGASLGNAICLFNIIAASAVAGVDNYAAILKKNLLAVLLSAFLASLLGMAILWVWY